MLKFRRIGFQFYSRMVTLRKDMLSIFLVAVASVLMREFWLINIPAPNKAMYIIGEIYNGICLSTIAAYIYYVVDSHIPNENKKVKMHRYINSKLLSIGSLKSSLVVTMRNAAEVAPRTPYTLSLEEVDNYAAVINPNTPIAYGAPTLIFPNWFALFHYIHVESKKLVDDLMKFSDSLDIEVLQQLANIEDMLFSHIDSRRGVTVANTDLTTWARSISRYITMCDELERTYISHSNLVNREYSMLHRERRCNQL